MGISSRRQQSIIIFPWPSFDRTPEENKRGNKVLRNIVIRPEADVYTRGVLPSTYDLIIIGDVTFGSVIDVAVKGIELIDSKIAKFGEKRVACVAACAFAEKNICKSRPYDYGC